MATTLDIEFVARVDKFKAEVEKIPGITKKQTREMVSEFQRSWKQAQQVSGGAIDQIANDAGKLQRIGGLIGGPVGEAMQIIADGSEAASDGLSGTAKAALGLGVGVAVVAAMGAAVANVVTNLDDYRDELDDLQDRGLVSPEQARAVEMMSAAISVIQQKARDWAVILTSRVAPAFNQVLLGGQYALTFLQTLVGEVGSDLAELATSLAAVVSSGFTDVSAAQKFRRVVYDLIDMEGELAIAAATAEEAARGWVADVADERSDALHAYNADARAEAAKLREEMQRAHEGMSSDIMAALGAETWDKVWAQAYGEQAAFEAASTAANQAWAEQIQQNAAMAAGAHADVEQAGAKAANASQRAARAIGDAWMSTASAVANGVTSLLSAVQAFNADVMRDQMRNASSASAAERRELRKRFKAQKAMAHAVVWINAAVGFMQAIAQYGPIAGAVIGALALGAAGIQSGLIERQQPTFDTGGMIQPAGRAPDRVQISAQPGEAVLSKQGVAAVGGRDGVDQINRGRSSPFGHPITAAAMVIGNRVIDAMWGGPDGMGRTGLAARVRASTGGVLGRRERAWGG